MARPLRIQYPGAYYHVTCRGNEQKEIFLDDKDQKVFLEKLSLLSGVGVVSPVKGHHVSPKEGRLISLVGGRPVSLTCDTEVSSVFSEHGGGDGAITHE